MSGDPQLATGPVSDPHSRPIDRWEQPDRRQVIPEAMGREIPPTAANSSMFLTLVRDTTSSPRTRRRLVRARPGLRPRWPRYLQCFKRPNFCRGWLGALGRKQAPGPPGRHLHLHLTTAQRLALRPLSSDASGAFNPLQARRRAEVTGIDERAERSLLRQCPPTGFQSQSGDREWAGKSVVCYTH